MIQNLHQPKVFYNSDKYRYFYVEPLLLVGDTVKRGDIIGYAQGLTDVYPGITSHFHFEIMKPGRGRSYRDRSNRIVTVLFVFFTMTSFMLNELMPVGPNIYLAEVGLIALFFMALVFCIERMEMKVTLMILALCATDIIMASMDIVAFLAYHYKATGVYAIAYDTAIQLTVVQYAALWVNDARRINIRRYYDNIKLYMRDFAMRSLYR